MSPANRAIFRSKAIGIADTLRMPPDEVIEATIRLAVEYARKAGTDRPALHDLVDHAHAVATVEGSPGGAP